MFQSRLGKNSYAAVTLEIWPRISHDWNSQNFEICPKNEAAPYATTTTATRIHFDALLRLEMVDKSHVQIGCPIKFLVRLKA